MNKIDRKLKELEEAYKTFRREELCEKEEAINKYKVKRDTILPVAFVGDFTDENCIYEYDKYVDIAIDKMGCLVEVVTVEGKYIKAISEHETTYDLMIFDLKEADEVEWVFEVETDISFDLLTKITLLAKEKGVESEEVKALISQLDYEVILEKN